MRRLFLLFLPLLLLCSCGQRSADGNDGTDRQARQYLDSAIVYIDRQDFRAAMLQLKRAEKLLPEIDDDKTGYQICQYIGWINENNGANSLALEYQQRALEYAHRYGKPEYEVDVLINQVNTLYNMQMNDSAWRVNLRAARYFRQVDAGQKSVILKNIAYYEMLHDSLPQAEHNAYRAAMLATDSSAVGNALSLLCQVYIRQNKYQQAQMLMGVIPQNGNTTLQYNRLLIESDYLEKRGDYRGALEKYHQLTALSDSLNATSRHLDIVKIQNQYDREIMQREKAEQKLGYSLAIIVLLLIISALTISYFRRTKSLYKKYSERLSSVKDSTELRLSRKDSTIEEMKQRIDAKVSEIESLKQQPLPTTDDRQAHRSIAQTKRGVDVLYAILHDQNISQYGRQEQRALVDVLWTIDRPLAIIMDNPVYALTPKETFFCIMEHSGKTDQQKAHSFCCSEQAVRSTKSRLGKKLDLHILQPPTTTDEPAAITQ
jgi:cell division protein FtsB